MILTTADMIVNTLPILTREGTSLVQELKASVQPHSATGRTVNSIRYEVKIEGDREILLVYGRPFIMALETGRKPTPQYTKPSFSFVNNIREWLKAKGGNASLAYAIAKSIHQKGTKPNPGIITPIVNSFAEKIMKEVTRQFADQYLQNMVRVFRK
jgi:hypothetical protein